MARLTHALSCPTLSGAAELAPGLGLEGGLGLVGGSPLRFALISTESFFGLSSKKASASSLHKKPVTMKWLLAVLDRKHVRPPGATHRSPTFPIRG